MRNRKSDKRIVLTGGGTTGHVSVNLALIPHLLDKGYEIYYLGSKKGIEKELITPLDRVKYVEISTGKLRRYFSWENLKDVFRVALGTLQASWQIFKIRPNIIFSKGGFVSVPVLIGGKINGVPSLTHESDLTPGLANKLVQPFVNQIFTTFPETSQYIKSGKGKYLGPVIRDELKDGKAYRAQLRFDLDNKPVILVMGGSLGARALNRKIREALPELTKTFNVVHACGKGELDDTIQNESYVQLEYIKEGLNDLFDLADIVVSRAGSNAIFEFLYYKIPMLLVPLPTRQSRGDQIDNAKSFERQGFAITVDEDTLTQENLLDRINRLHDNKQIYVENMEKVNFQNSLETLLDSIEKNNKS